MSTTPPSATSQRQESGVTAWARPSCETRKMPRLSPVPITPATIGRVAYEAAGDDESLEALAECCRAEGILPAIETAHAFAGAKRYAQANPGSRILIGLSGRGDKDMPTLQRTLLKGKL